MTTTNTTLKPESVEEIVERFQEVLSNYEKKIVDVHPTDYFKETLTTHAFHAYTRGREKEREKILKEIVTWAETLEEIPCSLRDEALVWKLVTLYEVRNRMKALSTNTENK
jgi:hypothetical protein